MTGSLLGGGADVDVATVTLELAVDVDTPDGGVGRDGGDEAGKNETERKLHLEYIEVGVGSKKVVLLREWIGRCSR